MRLHPWRCRRIALAVLASASVASAQARDPLATVGPTVLRDASGQPTINIVSTAYMRSDVKDSSQRLLPGARKSAVAARLSWPKSELSS
jgi:hypothetical protein